MRLNRLFLTQEVLSRWLDDGRAVLEDEMLILEPSGHRLRLLTAYRFDQEVASGQDLLELVGTVKDASQLDQLEGEYQAGAVVIGDAAYSVTEGFLGVPEG